MTNKRHSSYPGEATKQKKAKHQELKTFSASFCQDDVESLGVIESVTLRNFMCHENLKFNFTPNVNFIVGENGSGKSAILTGIIIALGGKSSLTGRHPNLRSFIKTGKQTAVISVTLSNEGSAAYKPDLYGSKIIVERTITADAASYKIKSESGSILSTAVKELAKILACLNIQIDNPVLILTQETSRTFLDSKNAKDKYKLFFRATQLDELQHGYSEAQNKCKESEHSLKCKQEILPELEKKIKKWKFILTQESRIKEYENELVWAQVQEIEQVADSKLKEFDERKDNMATAKCSLQKAKEKCTILCQEIAEAKATIKTCEADKGYLKNAVQDLASKLQPLNNKRSELKVKQSKIDQDIEKNTSGMKKLQLNITQMAEKSQLDVSKEKAERDMRIHQLENKATEIEKEYNALYTERSSWVTKISLEEKEKETLMFELINLERQRNHADRDLKVMKSSVKDPSQIFGSEMKNLLIDIQKSAMHFKQLPVGPIGMYIKVRDKEWSFAVEVALKQNFLRNFCCDNFQDRAFLISHIEKHFPRGKQAPSIIVSKFLDKVHDVCTHKVQSDHLTIMDVLEIQHPVVGNCLIDQSHIERTLLVKNKTVAVDLMMRNPPKNCLLCYTPDGDQIFPSPKYRFYSCRKNPNSMCLLQSVKEDDIRCKQAAFEKLASECLLKNNHIRTKLQLIKDYEEQNNFFFCKLKDVNCSKETIQQQLKDAKTYVEPKDLNCLEEDLELQIDVISKLKHEKETMEHLSTLVGNELNALRMEHMQKRDLFSEKSTLCSQLQDDLVELEGKKERANYEQSQCDNIFKQNNARLSSIVQELSEAKAAAEESVLKALTICQRIHTRKTVDSIKAILCETKKDLENESECRKEDIKANYLEQKKNFNKVKKEIDGLISSHEKLQRMVVSRLLGYEKILRCASLNVNYCFSINLKTNKYTGTLEFNHERETLSIAAKPLERSRKSHVNTKELSGGERSYVTISLLLALWECVKMPFRILDEYDVFMDCVNRQLSLTLMMDKATKEKNTQFIFLSPQELPVMQNTPLVKVHKMPAPKRCAN